MASNEKESRNLISNYSTIFTYGPFGKNITKPVSYLFLTASKSMCGMYFGCDKQRLEHVKWQNPKMYMQMVCISRLLFY